MRDRYIVYQNGERRLVSNLSVVEIYECLELLAELKPMDGTEATHDDIRLRLEIELIARGVK